MKNPWLGLSAYTEESLNEYHFYGRSAAIIDLSSLIRGNLFVTLYGRSGIGKTSLLQAGVFPVLRENGMLPVAIRLNGVSDDKNPAAETVWEILLTTLEASGYKYTACDSTDQYTPDFSEVMVFRKLFSAGRFLNAAGEETLPVIALDQFEEILYNAPKTGRLLIAQLYALIDDNYNLNVLHPHWHDDTNFRVVISIREDDLYLFEDLIDTINCSELKSNRFRLLPLSEDEALEVVLKPSQGIFEPGHEEEIAHKIISLAKNGTDNISTLMLSVYCHTLFNDCYFRNGVIKISDLKNYGNNLETYYKEIIKSIPKKQRYYLENKLIDGQGRRRFIYLSELKEHAPAAIKFIENSDKRLLSLNQEQGRVEYIHDQLAYAIYNIRTLRKNYEAKRMGAVWLTLALLVILIYSLSQFPSFNSSTELSSKECVILQNNTMVRKFIIDSLDSNNFNIYSIRDCPNLKSLIINNKNANVTISHCPRLSEIGFPESFSGSVDAIYCPKLSSSKITYHDDDLSQQKSDRRTEANLGVYTSHNIRRSSIYDSLNNIIRILYAPRANSNLYVNKIFSGEGEIAIYPNLPDSIKEITDCYVPYGTINEFEQLEAYSLFNDIKEMPIYYNWYIHFNQIFNYYSEPGLLQILTFIGIFALLAVCILILSGSKLSGLKKSLLFKLSFIGLIIVLAILSFMAGYWFVYNIISPYNTVLSLIVGSLTCLISLLFILTDTFYSFIFYVQDRGIKSIPKDFLPFIIKKSKKLPRTIKRSLKIIIIFTILCSIAIVIAFSYVNGREKRLNYIKELHKYKWVSSLYTLSLIEELEKQHSNVFYGFFTDSLHAIKNRIEKDGECLVSTLWDSEINKVVKTQNRNLISFENYWPSHLYSDDGENLSLLVQGLMQSSDSVRNEQYVYLNLWKEAIDTISRKYNSKSFYTAGSSFSPSGKIIVSSTNDVFNHYDIEKHKLRELPCQSSQKIESFILVDDSLMYYIADDHNLYAANLNNKEIIPLKKSRYKNRWQGSLTLMDSSHFAAVSYVDNIPNKHEVLVYNHKTDSIVYNSDCSDIEKLYGITSDYALTDKGLFNLKTSDVNVSDTKYAIFKGSIVYYLFDKNNNETSSYFIKFFNSQGKLFKTIPCGFDRPSDLKLSRDGRYLIDPKRSKIYKFDDYKDDKFPILEYDKKIFDLK